MIASLLSIWPTTGCNLLCRYCFYEGSPIWAKQKDMTIETANAVIKLINSGLIGAISFFGGEPLMNWPIVKHILDETYLEEIWHEKKTYYNITTNGTLLTPEIFDMFKEREVHISLSFDGKKETQNHWRGNSYEAIMKNLELLLSYPKLQVLKTMATPDTLYEDIKHIKELGFRGIFINLLDPFSHFTYEECDVEVFKKQYRRVVEELMGPDFLVGDYNRWKNLIVKVHEGKKNFGCGFTNNGLAVAPDGRLYPCHQGPSNEDLAIGDIWDGINELKSKIIRSAEPSPLCVKCAYQFNKCPQTMYLKHGCFGMNAPPWYMKFELAKIRVIEDIEGLPHLETPCEQLIGSEKPN